MNKRQRKKQYSRLDNCLRRHQKRMASRHQSVRTHGRWEVIRDWYPWEEHDRVERYRCSVCRRWVLAVKDLEIERILPYCVCGAKMDGGAER